jgi:hypothetical protein
MPFLNKSGLILTVCCLISLAGCGGSDGTPPLHQLSGTLTHDGKPVSNVHVNMTVEGKRPSSGVTDENGMFTMTYTVGNPGVVPGENRVTLKSLSGDPDVDPIPEDQIEILDKYSEEKSTLTITIDQDHEQYDLILD